MKLTDIILEGRKEDIKKQLLTKYPEAETLIDAALRSDPTGTKYIEYINRSFDDLYPVLKSWDKENNILDYFDNIGWWEKNYNKISINDLDSIYEDAKTNQVSSTLLSSISSIDPKQIKDINSWDIRLLKYVRDYVNTKKSRREVEREAKAGAELVYESPNKQVLLFKIKTHAASCYYGANTKWCTTSKDVPGHFQRETQNYGLYYLIDRTRQRQKLAVQIPNRKGSPILVWKENDNKTNLQYLLNLYPEMEEYFITVSSSNQTIEFLNSLTIDEVKERSWWNVQYPDDLIDNIRVISQDDNESIVVTLKFEDSPNDFWDMWDINEYDRRMIDNILSHYGSSWEFHDRYTADEDWSEGYLWGYSSEKQDKEIKDLAIKLFPQYRKDLLTKNLEDMPSDFSHMLSSVFDRAVEDIIDEITISRNRESEGSVTNYLKDEYCNIFHNVGGEVLTCFYKYAFSRDKLVELLKNYPSGTIFNSLKSFVNSDDVAVDAPYELYDLAHNIWNKGDDDEDYYEDVKRRFDSLIEAMIDKLSDEDIGDFQERNEEYNKFMKFLDKRGIGLGVWYSLPADNQFDFRIDDILFNTSSVEVSVSSKDRSSIKKYEPSFEEFITLLFNYQLFR
jgi:hypothetical protein